MVSTHFYYEFPINGLLGNLLILNLELKIYKMSLKHLVVLEIKEVLKTKVYQSDTGVNRKIPQWPKMKQLERKKIMTY